MALEASEMARRRLFADAFERVPALGHALDAARGVCEKFQGTHPSGRRCNKRGDKCPMLHVKPGQELSLASNRLHAPFVHATPWVTHFPGVTADQDLDLEKTRVTDFMQICLIHLQACPNL